MESLKPGFQAISPFILGGFAPAGVIEGNRPMGRCYCLRLCPSRDCSSTIRSQVYNKIDQISMEEVDRLARKPNSVVIR